MPVTAKFMVSCHGESESEIGAMRGEDYGPRRICDAFGNPGIEIRDKEFPLYEIRIVKNLFDLTNPCLASYIGAKRIFALFDHSVAKFYGSKITRYFDDHSIRHVDLKLPLRRFNERNKSLAMLEKLAKEMHAYHPSTADLAI